MRLVREKLPLFLLGAASAVVTFVVHERGGAVVTLDNASAGYRIANAAVSYSVYLLKMVWPSGLAPAYLYRHGLPAWEFAAAAVALAAISGAILLAARRFPYLLVGWCWYLGTMLPVIGIVQVGSQSMADRYTYIPFLGIFIIVAWGGWDLARSRVRPAVAVAAAVLAVLACGLLGWKQVRYWEGPETLWGRALAINPTNQIAETNLGSWLLDQGRIEESIAHLTAATRIDPNSHVARNQLGCAFQRLGKVDLALDQFTEAVRIDPGYAEAYNNLGVALCATGRIDEAIAPYREALRLQPDYVGASDNLAAALLARHREAEAIEQCNRTLRMDPRDAQARQMLEHLR
jgi:tetratricopeptide (TPR) repeat protein